MHGGSDLLWRLLIDGEEHLVASVIFHCQTFTSQDQLPSGEIKYHLSCTAKKLIWTEDRKGVEVF